jgi:hypothetical protein
MLLRALTKKFLGKTEKKNTVRKVFYVGDISALL